MTVLPLVSPEVDGLVPYVKAGLLVAGDVQVARTIARATGDASIEVVLAAALAVRAVRLGHVCIVLDEISDSVYADVGESEVSGLTWPNPVMWRAMLAKSPAVLVEDGGSNGGTEPTEGRDRHRIAPLVLDGDRLYLERYWRYERDLADDLVRLSDGAGALFADGAPIEDALDTLFGTADVRDLQRKAAALALTNRLAVIAGGPGTGKTAMLARAYAAGLMLARRQGDDFRAAIAAPTATAAKRVTLAIGRELGQLVVATDGSTSVPGVEATTIHRLLGARRAGEYAFGRAHRLPYNFVAVDEVSMVSLPLMARLIESLAPGASLVLVGDPYQLASVEAGAVLGEIVGSRFGTDIAPGPLSGSIIHLERQHRFDEQSSIASLASAVREGDVGRALELLHDDSDGVRWVRADDDAGIDELRELLCGSAVGVVEWARSGQVEQAIERLRETKVLAATRHGAFGLYRWNEAIEARIGDRLEDFPLRNAWYVGRPIIVNRNDNLNRIYNGDVGVVVDVGRPMVALVDGPEYRYVPPTQLDDVDTWWAMTIHKSQGSEFDHVIVSLPLAPSPILTRELLYTALTRARQRVTVVASEEAIASAISRPARRSSGLGERLWKRSSS